MTPPVPVPEDHAFFEATVTPHRSLGPAGIRRLVAFMLTLSATVSTVVWLIGAWPVIAFNGAEILLAVLLLRANVRASRRHERLLLSGDGLQIIHTDARGRIRRRRLPGRWLQAVLEDRPGRTPALLLVERGRRMEVGADLGEIEKRALANALAQALYAQRNPRFDNAQLQATPRQAPST